MFDSWPIVEIDTFGPARDRFPSSAAELARGNGSRSGLLKSPRKLKTGSDLIYMERDRRTYERPCEES